MGLNTTGIGRAAEELAAGHLESVGLRIIDRNWRNRWCEIDIVALDSAGVIRFIEVKYRRNVEFGYGYEYISRDKSARLRRAALAWMHFRNRSGDYAIDVISVSGEGDILYLKDAITE